MEGSVGVSVHSEQILNESVSKVNPCNQQDTIGLSLGLSRFLSCLGTTATPFSMSTTINVHACWQPNDTSTPPAITNIY